MWAGHAQGAGEGEGSQCSWGEAPEAARHGSQRRRPSASWDTNGYQPNGWASGGWGASSWGCGSWEQPRGGSLKRTLDYYPPPPSWKRHASEAQVELNRANSWPSESVPPQMPWAGHGSISEHDRADIIQWRDCTCVGLNVTGTPIVPCKTPFEGPLADRAYENGLIEDAHWFGREDLLRICREQGTPVGLVIDLVNTQKYYTGFRGEVEGLEYQKVRIQGRTVPDRAILEQIFDTIDEFVVRRPTEYVAIHCTHGINRTGFVVAAYLMTRAHLPKRKQAVQAFEDARGSKIDKEYLIEALDRLEEGTY